MKRPNRTIASPRRRELATCDQAVADVIASHGLARQLDAHQVVVQWPRIVGERIAARTWPDGLSRRVLWVRVASSAWLQELNLLRPQLLRQLHTALPAPPLFVELRFHLGHRRATDDDLIANVVRPSGRATPVRRAFTPATPERADQIDQESAIVDDPDLRALISGLRKRVDR